jgi:hypothetical protein
MAAHRKVTIGSPGTIIDFLEAFRFPVKPYQKTMLLRLSFSNAYRRFMPPEPFNFERYRYKPQGHNWRKIFIDDIEIPTDSPSPWSL